MTKQGRLKKVYREADARRINLESGELWIFEHRGMSIWYKGVNPESSWSISIDPKDFDQDQMDQPTTWLTSFYYDGKLREVEGLKVADILLKEITIWGEPFWDSDMPYLDERDVGKKGYILTDKGKFEIELIEVFSLPPEEQEQEDEFLIHEWIDEITGVLCLEIHWDKEV
jgi:hypothetical protein